MGARKPQARFAVMAIAAAAAVLTITLPMLVWQSGVLSTVPGDGNAANITTHDTTAAVSQQIMNTTIAKATASPLDSVAHEGVSLKLSGSIAGATSTN
jgi:hypothetical protein